MNFKELLGKQMLFFDGATGTQLQARGLDHDGALAYYHDWLYQVVKVHLAQDWACIGGMDEVFACIETALARYY